MRVCIPASQDAGLASRVSAHFGSAKYFAIVDTDSGSCRVITNGNRHHAHGMCAPFESIAGLDLDAVAVGGIGMGALSKLRSNGIRVFISPPSTVEETAAALKAGLLAEATPANACPGHGHEGHAHPSQADGINDLRQGPGRDPVGG